MRIRPFLIFGCAAALFMPGRAFAASWWDWIFPPPVEDYTRVYFEDGKIPHLSVRQQDPALIDAWIQERGGARAFMRDLYNDDVVRRWDMPDGETPVLKVGRTFMDLSGQDKQHVAEFIDRAYGVTRKSPSGMFLIRHWRSDKPIGVYTQYGLQLQ